MGIFGFIADPLGDFMYFIYNNMAFKNYGIAIILFTVIIKLILLPLTVKQMKSTTKMQEIQPKIQELQKRYKNDKQKLNEEMMKLYQENKVNPMGGCLPLLVQMPILISLFQVFRNPLLYMLNKSQETVDTLSNYVAENVDKMTHYVQIDILNYFNEHIDELRQFGDMLKPEELINFQFIGLQLGRVPSISTDKLFGPESHIYLPLLFIPIVGVAATFISSKLMTANSSSKNAGKSSTNKSMMYLGPVLTLVFSFQLPAGVGLYWIAGYIFQIFQQLYINKVVLKKED